MRKKNNIRKPYEEWEFEMASQWSTNSLKNYIFLAVSAGQPVPGCVSVEALRAVLTSRGEEPEGYHGT